MSGPKNKAVAVMIKSGHTLAHELCTQKLNISVEH